jgi:hypothetical protein
MRALETAVVVCYWRPFASANEVKLNAEERVPADEGAKLAHELLKKLRDRFSRGGASTRRETK